MVEDGQGLSCQEDRAVAALKGMKDPTALASCLLQVVAGLPADTQSSEIA